MKFPIEIYAGYSQSVSLLTAVLLGTGFGFFLERAGFGSARKLAAQFYLRDFAVLKVMFTAIVVAGVGFWWLVSLGLLDLSSTYINPTFLWAQIFGGLILGVGFVIGGYCPGTSCVAISTGKMDALFYMGGVIFGIFIFSEAESLFHTLRMSGSMGVRFVWEWLGVSPGFVMLLAVLMAVGSFTWGTIVEKKKNGVVEP